MDPKAIADMIKNNPLLGNPALLSLNPQLYAVQLAQLQAGLQQLAAAAAINNAPKEANKEEDDNALNLTKRSPSPPPPTSTFTDRRRTESPLDLSGFATARRQVGLFQ